MRLGRLMGLAILVIAAGNAGTTLRAEAAPVQRQPEAQRTAVSPSQPPASRQFSRDLPVSDPTFTFAYGDQESPAVARGSDGAIVVWADERNNDFDIVGTRLDDAGHVLDPGGIDFTPDRRYWQTNPSIAWNGVDYLLVWSDGRSANSNDIYGALINASGAVLSRFPISTAPDWQDHPSVAWNGTTFLVAWDAHNHGGSAPEDVWAARVTAGGAVLDPAGIPIATSTALQEATSVASDGAGFFVVWQDESLGGGYDIFGARIEPDGTDLDPNGIHVAVAANDQEFPAVDWNGSEYLVAWTDGRVYPTAGIYCTRVTSDGQVLDPAGIEVSASHSDGSPAVAWDGSDFFVSWSRALDGSVNWDLYGSRVTPSGDVLDPDGRQLTSSPQAEIGPALAPLGSGLWMAWNDRRNPDLSGYRQWDIYGERIADDGTTSPDEIVSSQPSPQDYPAVAWNGSEYLVAWLDLRSGDPQGDLYVGRISATGQILDGTGTLVSAGSGWRGPPRVVSDGTNFLVTWSEGSPIHVLAARVTAGGAVEDPGGFPLTDPTTFSSDPSVAWDGTAYLVTWDSADGIFGARVTSDGVVIDDPPFAIATDAWDEYSPRVAWDGSNFLVTWDDSRGAVDHIYGARVSPYGIVLDPGGFQISHGPGEWDQSVVYGGGEYLVDWVNDDYRVQGARVTTDGTVLDNVIGISFWDSRDPAAGWDGTNFVAAWSGEGESSDDLLTARIGVNGHVLDPGGIAIWSSSVNEWAPAVATGPAGSAAIVFQRSEGYSGSSRIYARFLNESSPLRAAKVER